jgi:hypothetical protein
MMQEKAIIVWMMPLVWLMMLTGCSSDDDSLSQQPATELSLVAVPLAPDYVAAGDNASPSRSGSTAITRSWTPPAGYYLYDKLYGDVYEGYERRTLTNSAINVCFTHLPHASETDDGNPTTEPNPLKTRLTYVGAATPYWKLVLPNTMKEENVKSGNYYVYGFIPNNAADVVDIDKYKYPDAAVGMWNEGAVLTIKGLKTTMADACVIIGAKNGPDADHDGGLTAGDFRFHLDTGTHKVGEEDVINPNYLYLLFDHLGCALTVSMKVHADYHKLRTIKLREMRMKTAGSDGTTKAKMDVTVKLKSNGTGSNPIESVVFEPVAASGESDGIVYQNREGLPLSPTPSKFLGHFLPIGVTKIILTCTYDVYDKDKKENLIRQGCKATNTIELKDLFTTFAGVRRGYKYTVNLTIKPTYLYMLSEPDEEDTSIVVE